MMFAMDVSPEMMFPMDESAYTSRMDAPQSGGANPYDFEARAVKSTDDTTYTLTVKNESKEAWIFYVYQTLPKQPADIFSLAWIASPYEIGPHQHVSFSWDIHYTLFWADSGTLQPGVTFAAGGSIPADPNAGDGADFSMVNGPNLKLSKPGAKGTLTIYDQSDVPNETFSVGIGMGDAGTFAVQAGTNLTHVFTPTPSYWIAAGLDQKVGTVLDIKTITQTAPVVFPTNVNYLTATLHEDHTWTVEP